MKSLHAGAVTVISVALVCSSFGCAMLQAGPNDKEMLTELLNGWKDAMEKGDVDATMSFFSKNYMDETGTDYDTYESRLEQILPVMANWETEYILDEVEVDIDGTVATLSHVGLDMAYNYVGITLTAEKEDGAWLIVNSEIEQ